MPRKHSCKNPSCGNTFYGNICGQCNAAFNVSKIDEKPAAKAAKKKNENRHSKHLTVYLSDGVFSVQYWQLHRCFVRVSSDLYNTGEDVNFCTKKECSDARIIEMRKEGGFFSCDHITKALDDVKNGFVIVG